MMFKKFVFLLIALNFFVGEAFGDSSFLFCDRSHFLLPGQSILIQSPLWPLNYPANSACRYRIEAPYDTQIQVTCNMNVPYSYSDGICRSGQFYISENGNLDITGIKPICGATTASKTSIANKLTLAYTTNDFTSRGWFACQVQAVCDCGWGLNSRIVGGKETAINEFPSTAALISTEYRALLCGATIVSHYFVSTAAHCLFKILPARTAVLVGDHNIDIGQESPYAALYIACSFIIHPNYNKDKQYNDIGLVRTCLPIDYNKGVGPACLPFLNRNDDFSGKTVTATGWGTQEFGGPTSPYLQKVDITVLKNADPKCKGSYPENIYSQMCTYRAGQDTCQYDSGGPLYYTTSRKFLVAQVSAGKGCGTVDPSLNTRITEYLDWIERETGPSILCHRYM